jgi:peptidyl-prolyl cis-trans isomerase C
MPEIDLELDRVWERLTDEPDDAHKAFVAYRALPAGTTVEEACRRAVGEEAAAQHTGQWAAWAEEWAWPGRAEKYRDSASSAARDARVLAERWASAKEFYADDTERPRSLLARLFGRRRRSHGSSRRSGGKALTTRPEPRPSALQRFMRDQEARRHFKAQEAAALRSAKPTKTRTLAERWTLFIQKQRHESKRNRDKGVRGWFRRRMQRAKVFARRRFGRFVLLFGLAFFLMGLAFGVLGMRWRRQRFQTAVVFTINGENIRRNTVQSKIEQVGGKPVVQELVEQTLRKQFAKAKKVYPKDSEVEARIKEDSRQPDFNKSIAAAGMTLDDYRKVISDELAQVNMMSKGVTVTDSEVQRYYRIHADRRNPRARFFTPETVQVAVIGTRSREAGLAALAELQEGVPWDEVARAHSLDVSAFQGGLLPAFGRGRTMCAQIPGMEAAIFGMQPGQRIGPVRFGEGWWLIQCREKAAEKTLSFDAVKHRARSWALLEKGVPVNGRRIASEYAAFQKKARVQVFDPFFRSLVGR